MFLFYQRSALAVRILGASVYRTRRVNDRTWKLEKGSQLETHIYVVGYPLNRLAEPVFMAVSKGCTTFFDICG